MNTNTLNKTPLMLLGLVWTLCACAPSPEDLCAHVEKVMIAELGESAKEALGDCVEDVERTKKSLGRKGPGEWRSYATCMMEAENVDALATCDE